MAANVKEIKRYNLGLPKELFDQLEALAEEEHTTVLEIIRRFIKLGLMAAKVQKNPNAALVIRDERGEREIVLV